MKRYFMIYESDRVICGSKDHTYGSAKQLKTAKAYISRCREKCAMDNPRNFRIYDILSDIDPETGFVRCVYQEP